MPELSNERLAAGLERLTPGWAGSLVAAMGARKNRFKEFGASVGQAETDLEVAVWLADNLPAIRAQLKQRRASVVSPEMVPEVQPLDTAPSGEDALEPDQIDIHEGAWALVIGTTGKPAGWIDSHALFAHQVYRDRLALSPTDETQGVKRAVAHRDAAFLRGMAIGYEADEHPDSRQGAARLNEIAVHIETAEASLAAMSEALEFYAAPENYRGEFVPGGHTDHGTFELAHHVNLVRKDGGERARATLSAGAQS